MKHTASYLVASIALTMSAQAPAATPKVPDGMTQSAMARAATLPIYSGGLRTSQQVIGQVIGNATIGEPGERRSLTSTSHPVSTGNAIASLRLNAVNMGADAVTHVECKDEIMAQPAFTQCEGDAVKYNHTGK